MALIDCKECGNQISDMAESCPRCGVPMSIIKKEPINLNNEDHSNTRSGVTKAKFNEQYSTWLFAQILILAIAGGIYWESWIIFGAILLGTIVLIGSNKIVGQIVGFLLAAGIGIAGYYVGNYWGEDAAIIVAIIAFLSALGANLAGIEWTQDINKK